MMATTKRGVREYHPFKEICNPKKKLDEGQDLSLCFKFVRKVCNETCRDRLTGKKYARTCHCLSIPRKNAARQAAVAKYMANFIAKPQQERHSIIMEWQRYTLTTTRNELCFFIPFISEDGDDELPFGMDGHNNDETKDGDDVDDEEEMNLEEHPLHALKKAMVCKDAISLLLDYGRIKWKTCQMAVVHNKLPDHGNKGKVLGNAKRFANEVKDDLHGFFHELKQFGTPKATRFVREETGSGLRDGEEDLVELPTTWSKRAVYSRFCYERGFVMTSTPRGNIKKTERSDPEWNNENHKTICSWGTFLHFWNRHYPMIRLGPPAADICTDCHVFFNRTKYMVPALDTNQDDDPISSGNDEDNDIRNDETIPYLHADAPPTGSLDQPEDDDDLEQPQNLQLDTHVAMLEKELILQKATLQVQQAMIQRQLANKKIQEAIDSADLPHSQLKYTFIADFSQNMELPCFGASQPGDTYYFSALKINVFGVVDCSIFGGKLSVHVYHEGVGKKGATMLPPFYSMNGKGSI